MKATRKIKKKSALVIYNLRWLALIYANIL